VGELLAATSNYLRSSRDLTSFQLHNTWIFSDRCRQLRYLTVTETLNLLTIQFVKDPSNLFSMSQHPKSFLGFLNVEVSRSHTFR
jgi:hypothetical protein